MDCNDCPHLEKDHYVTKDESVTGCMWCICHEFSKKSRADIAADKKEAAAEEKAEEEKDR